MAVVAVFAAIVVAVFALTAVQNPQDDRDGSRTATIAEAQADSGREAQDNAKVLLQVNGESGTVAIRRGDPYFYSWRTRGQQVCQMVSPFPSGSTLQGASSAVVPGASFYYPTPERPVLLRMTCSDKNGVETTSEVTVTLAPEVAVANSTTEDRLIEIGFTLKQDDKPAAANAIEEIKRLELTTENERARAAYHLFSAYRTLGDLQAACRALREVSQIAAKTDYKRAIDGADANFCFGVLGTARGSRKAEMCEPHVDLRIEPTTVYRQRLASCITDVLSRSAIEGKTRWVHNPAKT